MRRLSSTVTATQMIGNDNSNSRDFLLYSVFSTFNQIGWQSLFNSLDADSTQNAVVSPVSIVGALYMLAHATTGEAQSEIYEVLSLGDTENPLERTNRTYESYESYMSHMSHII